MTASCVGPGDIGWTECRCFLVTIPVPEDSCIGSFWMGRSESVYLLATRAPYPVGSADDPMVVTRDLIHLSGGSHLHCSSPPQDEHPVRVPGRVAALGSRRIVGGSGCAGRGRAAHRIDPRNGVAGLHLRLVDGDVE